MENRWNKLMYTWCFGAELVVALASVLSISILGRLRGLKEFHRKDTVRTNLLQYLESIVQTGELRVKNCELCSAKNGQ